MCERELGVVLDKSAQTSMWTRRPLDPEQVRYAAMDAEVLLGLYERLAAVLREEPEQLPLYPGSPG